MRRLTALAAVAVAVAAGLASPALADEAYRAEVQKWRQERETRLKADGGWLTLAGLFWLKEGPNRFGTDPAGDIVLPEGSAPAKAGVFELKGEQVTVALQPGASGRIGGKAVSGATAMRPDTSGSPDVLEMGTLTMNVIKRGDRYGIRLKDKNSARPQGLHGPQVVRHPGGLSRRSAVGLVPAAQAGQGAERAGADRVDAEPGLRRVHAGREARARRRRPGGPARRAALLHPARPDERQGDLRGRALPLRGPAEGREGRAGLQQGLQPALRLHALRHLPAAPAPELDARAGRGRRDGLRQGAHPSAPGP